MSAAKHEKHPSETMVGVGDDITDLGPWNGRCLTSGLELPRTCQKIRPV